MALTGDGRGLSLWRQKAFEGVPADDWEDGHCLWFGEIVLPDCGLGAFSFCGLWGGAERFRRAQAKSCPFVAVPPRRPAPTRLSLMINPALEKRYADCTELIQVWKQYQDFFNKAVKEDSELPPELEAKFMECKGTIAMLHDSLMESLKEDRDIGQNMLSIVNRSITLKHVRRLGQADKKKIEIEWHECYLQLNETVSVLGEQREKLAKVSKFQERMGKMSESAHVGTHNFFSSLLFRVIIAAVVIAGLVIFVPWNDLRDYGTPGRWYQAVLDFGRDELGIIEAPFGSMDRFGNRFMDQQAPAGITIAMPDETSEQAFRNRVQFVNISGQNGDEYLGTRQDFRQRTFNTTSGGQPVPVNAGAFYWYERSRAEIFEREFRLLADGEPADPRAQQIEVARVHNVLVVLVGGTPDARRRVREEVFGN